MTFWKVESINGTDLTHSRELGSKLAVGHGKTQSELSMETSEGSGVWHQVPPEGKGKSESWLANIRSLNPFPRFTLMEDCLSPNPDKIKVGLGVWFCLFVSQRNKTERVSAMKKTRHSQGHGYFIDIKGIKATCT